MNKQAMSEHDQEVQRFYDDIGWEYVDDQSKDALINEDLRDVAKGYVSACRMRVCKHIPHAGVKILDMASGPIQYPEYLRYSENFSKRYCVDLSRKALDIAESRIGEHGEYLHGSFFDLSIEEDTFDCALSVHTIYHMPKDMQASAVRRLLHVTKRGKPVVIIYSNPDILVKKVLTLCKRAMRLFKKHAPNGNTDQNLYFYSHSHDWWRQFEDVADIKMYPWRSFSSRHQKMLFPDNIIGKLMFKVLFFLEDRFPVFFVRHFKYAMIVMRKKREGVI